MSDIKHLLYRTHYGIGGIFALVACLLLVACGEKEVPLPPLPEGPQVLTGTLLPAELSLSRRGTHVLRIDGVDTYFVESSLISLHSYEHQLVSLRGTLERNTDKTSLPVLRVEEVLNVKKKTMKKWVLRSLGLTLKAPEQWNGKVFIDYTNFYIPDSNTPIVTIAFEQLEELPQGPSIVLGTKRAVRTLHEATGEQKVTLAYRDSYLVFTFTPVPDAPNDMLREDWLTMLQSIEFSPENNQPTSTGTGSALGTPCGGPAGILCPTGYYCDITHLEENIGVCRGL